jgi:hypothetical protein
MWLNISSWRVSFLEQQETELFEGYGSIGPIKWFLEEDYHWKCCSILNCKS